jgi:hypothetical protein
MLITSAKDAGNTTMTKVQEKTKDRENKQSTQNRKQAQNSNSKEAGGTVQTVKHNQGKEHLLHTTCSMHRNRLPNDESMYPVKHSG